MQAFFDAFTALAQTQSILIYVIIFFGKLTEVTTATLRIVLINRGIRALGCMLAVFEIILWLIITSTVLTGFQSDPWKIIVYAAAYACGNFMGSWLDEKLAFGLSSIQIVVKDVETAHAVSNALRGAGFGITTMDVHGIDNTERYMMVTMVQRKTVTEALRIVNRVTDSALITVSDVKVQKGGYFRTSASRPNTRLPWQRKAGKASVPSDTAAKEENPEERDNAQCTDGAIGGNKDVHSLQGTEPRQ